jgi:large subunit ribosomal protein L29
MANKKSLEYKDFSNEDLKNELVNKENEYKNLRFDHAVTGLENPLLLRELRKEIARLNTEIRSREMAEMTAEDLANRSKIRRRRKANK